MISQEQKDKEFKNEHSYPYNADFVFETVMERINLDEEEKADIYSGNGFIVNEPKSIKKDLKDPNGIFSTKYGQGLSDVNPFIDRYKCQCGNLKSRINQGIECPLCHTKVKYVSDNYQYFGWMVLKGDYHIIHPNLYKSIEFFFGSGGATRGQKEKKSKLYNILNCQGVVDGDGHYHELSEEDKPADQPFFGIGMIDFYNRFDEIMDYYLKKYPKKKEYYDDIMDNREKVFIQSIPVFTTHLRPLDICDSTMYFEPINGIYNMMNKLVYEINQTKTKFSRKKKPKNLLLFDLQSKYSELYKEIEAILEGKKGRIRQLIGGRMTFSARAVISQDPSLRIDQLTLPYSELVITQQQKIINILQRTYNISPSEAYDIWYKSIGEFNERVADIITSIIKSYPNGMPVLLNRNPTINYGSIMQMYVIGFNRTFTIGVPLQILKPLAADFDGDTLNVFHIINAAFQRRCEEVFNPRNAMYISRNNGYFNLDVCVQRDTVICANTLMNIGRINYTQEQIEKIKALKNKNRTA